MTVWFCSDLHISHKLVAKYRWEFEHPFEAQDGQVLPDSALKEWHDSLLAHRWDVVVRPEDQVWVLGDISLGGKKNELNALNWIKQRPGEKHLIAGNHDSIHPSHRNSHKWYKVYLEAFSSVQMAARRKFSWPGIKGQNSAEVLLSHFPYSMDRAGEESRCSQWRLKNEGNILLHGHTHSHDIISYEIRDAALNFPIQSPTPQIHVGMDAWAYTPVSFEDIAHIVQWAEQGLPVATDLPLPNR